MSVADFFTKKELFIKAVSSITGVAIGNIEITAIRIVQSERRRLLSTQLQISIEIVLIDRTQSTSVMSKMASDNLNIENARNGIPTLQIIGFQTVEPTQVPVNGNPMTLSSGITTPPPHQHTHTLAVDVTNTNNNNNAFGHNHTELANVRYHSSFSVIQVVLIVVLNIGIGMGVLSYIYYRTRDTQQPPDISFNYSHDELNRRPPVLISV